jgi:hypothetical protein
MRWSKLTWENVGRAAVVPGGSGRILSCSRSVAKQILMQLAAQDIGHLTDFEPLLTDDCRTRLPVR